MTSTWTDSRNQMNISTVKAELQIQSNLEMSCSDFYNFAIKNKELLKAAKSDSKYSFKIKGN